MLSTAPEGRGERDPQARQGYLENYNAPNSEVRLVSVAVSCERLLFSWLRIPGWLRAPVSPHSRFPSRFPSPGTPVISSVTGSAFAGFVPPNSWTRRPSRLRSIGPSCSCSTVHATAAFLTVAEPTVGGPASVA